jgi:hypothetical protein
MLPSREFRFLSYVLGNIAPFLGCSENLAHTTLEVVNGFPRQPVAEFSAEEALQLFSRKLPKVSLVESWIEMHVACPSPLQFMRPQASILSRLATAD